MSVDLEVRELDQISREGAEVALATMPRQVTLLIESGIHHDGLPKRTVVEGRLGSTWFEDDPTTLNLRLVLKSFHVKWRLTDEAAFYLTAAGLAVFDDGSRLVIQATGLC